MRTIKPDKLSDKISTKFSTSPPTSPTNDLQQVDETEGLLGTSTSRTTEYLALDLQDRVPNENKPLSQVEDMVVGFWTDFINFIMVTDVFSLGLGIIIGTSFTDVINSFVTDVLTPPIGLLLGDSSFKNMFVVLKYGPKGSPTNPYETIQQALLDGAITINFGSFFENMFKFVAVTFVLFWLIKVYKLVYTSWQRLNLKKKASKVIELNKGNKTEHLCRFCKLKVHPDALKCPHCTSVLKNQYYELVSE